MQKNLLPLPLLLLSLVSQNILSMEKSEQSATPLLTREEIQQRREKLGLPSTSSILEALKLHPIYVQQQKQRPKTKSHQDKQQQEEVNLAISQIINGTIPASDEKESATPETSATIKTGYNWTLRIKALTYSASDLLLYALSQNMFEPDNTDHQALINQGVLECVQAQNNEKLIAILTFAKEQHSGKIRLNEQASENAYQQLNNAQKTQTVTLINNFEQLNAAKQTECVAILQKLQELHENALKQTVELCNALNSECTATKAHYLVLNNEHKKAVSALQKLSPFTFGPRPQTKSWNELTKNIQPTSKNINLTITGLDRHKTAISAVLLENKQ